VIITQNLAVFLPGLNSKGKKCRVKKWLQNQKKINDKGYFILKGKKIIEKRIQEWEIC